MQSWVTTHILETLVLFATGVEALALIYIYRLEKRQFELEEWRSRIDLRVDIDFPEGYTTGAPSIWIENAGSGSGFIESCELIVIEEQTQAKWVWRCPMAGKRKLPGLESIRVELLPGLRNIAGNWWSSERPKLDITLLASVLVLGERRTQIQRNSRVYRSSMPSNTGNLSELIPV